jgi:probable F420-dependent oxidoreductase
MRYGLFGINVGVCADPDAIRRVATAAEQAGFDSLWTGEHVVLPDPQVPPSPSPPDVPFLDPAVALAFAAAHTSRVLLATGVIILPQRNPLVLAKELASVDVLSRGRLVFGIGVGYLEPEFRALGISFEDKGARTNDYLAAILALWTQKSPRFEGRFVRFGGIDAMPRPSRKPHPPIVMGGATGPSLRRAVRSADGWYGFNLDPERVAECLRGLERAAAEVERGSGLGRLEITVTPPPRVELDRAMVRRYADLGVDRLVVYPLVRSADEVLGFVETTAARLIHGARE